MNKYRQQLVCKVIDNTKANLTIRHKKNDTKKPLPVKNQQG